MANHVEVLDAGTPEEPDRVRVVVRSESERDLSAFDTKAELHRKIDTARPADDAPES